MLLALQCLRYPAIEFHSGDFGEKLPFTTIYLHSFLYDFISNIRNSKWPFCILVFPLPRKYALTDHRK